MILYGKTFRAIMNTGDWTEYERTRDEINTQTGPKQQIMKIDLKERTDMAETMTHK